MSTLTAEYSEIDCTIIFSINFASSLLGIRTPNQTVPVGTGQDTSTPTSTINLVTKSGLRLKRRSNFEFKKVYVIDLSKKIIAPVCT